MKLVAAISSVKPGIQFSFQIGKEDIKLLNHFIVGPQHFRKHFGDRIAGNVQAFSSDLHGHWYSGFNVGVVVTYPALFFVRQVDFVAIDK